MYNCSTSSYTYSNIQLLCVELNKCKYNFLILYLYKYLLHIKQQYYMSKVAGKKIWVGND